MTDFKAKMHQIRFRLGLRPRPRWGSLPRSPRPLARFGAASRQGKGLCWGRGGKGEGKGREGEVEGREIEGPQVTVEPGPLRALLRHCADAITLSSTPQNSTNFERKTNTYGCSRLLVDLKLFSSG